MYACERIGRDGNCSILRGSFKIVPTCTTDLAFWIFCLVKYAEVKQSLSYAEKEREIDLKEREAIVYRAESLQREFEHVNKLLQVCLFLFYWIEHSNVPKFFKIYSSEFQNEIILN